MVTKRKSVLLEKSDKVIRQIYQASIEFPYKYQSSVGDQLRRVSLSIVLNIVEAAAKFSKKEKTQFLKIAFSSLKETKYLLYFSKGIDLITDDFYKKSIADLEEIAKLLYGIISKKS